MAEECSRKFLGRFVGVTSGRISAGVSVAEGCSRKFLGRFVRVTSGRISGGVSVAEASSAGSALHEPHRPQRQRPLGRSTAEHARERGR